ncbi:MAG: flagellar biosynthesis anti-sigma factor FlgM [Lachnospiraceae bacterium]|nr:flagellar biosynthesis anti-sigma factor FlgM [Lachnospiraceae bacterium]
MRIEAYNQVANVYQAQKVQKTQKTNAVAHASDQISISSFGKDMQVAKAALANTPDIREDLTADIKKQVQNGTYNVSTESFADKLMAKFQQGLV